MKPAPFEYFDPRTLAEALSLLQTHGNDAKLLAGGQSLVPLLNMRLARPATVIDINRVEGLDYIEERDGVLAVGALTRQRAVERSELIERRLPLLRAATRLIGHPQIRNRGTVGGSLAHADPAAEYPAVALALDAELRVAGPAGERMVPAGEFFRTYLTTALQADELLVEVRWPVLREHTGWSIMEVARRHGDFALAGAVTTLTLDANGRCAGARVVLFGVGAAPVRAHAAEEALAGRAPSAATCEEAGRLAAEAVAEPLADVHASSGFRRQLARVLCRRALAEAAARAERAS